MTMKGYEKYLVPGNIVVTGEAKEHGIILANGVVVYLDINGYDTVSSLIDAEEWYVLKVFAPTENITDRKDLINEEHLDLVYEYKPSTSFEDLEYNTEYTFQTSSSSYVVKVEMFDDNKVVLVRNISANILNVFTPDYFKSMFGSNKFYEKE